MSIIDKDSIDDQQLLDLSDLSDSLVSTARFDLRMKKSKRNAEKTLASRSQETIEKQNKFKEQKANDTARVAILSVELRKLKEELYNSLIKSTKEKGVDEALKEYDTQLKIFKEKSDEEFTILRKKYFNYISFYDYLFIELSSANENFVFVSPNDALLHLQQKTFDKLNDKQLNVLLRKYEKANLIDNDIFEKKYMKCFPAMINKITNIDDFIYAMIRHPEYYSQMNKELRKNISLYAPELKSIMTRNPRLIQYMPAEDLDLVTSRYNNFIGGIIANNPKVLDVLYPAFFRTHNPKYIFNNVNKTKLYPKIEGYLTKFPELRAFFSKSLIKIYSKNADQTKPNINETDEINL